MPFVNVIKSAAAPPGVTDPFFSNVILLLSGAAGSGAVNPVDYSVNGRTPTALGSVTCTQSVTLFGAGSVDCPNSTAMVYSNSSDYFRMSDSNSDPFTIDGWIMVDTFEDGDTVIGVHNGQNGDYSWNLQISGTDELKFQTSPDGTFASSAVIGPTTANISTGTWTFFAVSKNASGKVRIHVGTSGTAPMVASATPANSAMSSETTEFSVGGPSGAGAGSNRFDGKLNWLRLTKDVCRYDTDSAIAVPTAAFPLS